MSDPEDNHPSHLSRSSPNCWRKRETSAKTRSFVQSEEELPIRGPVIDVGKTVDEFEIARTSDKRETFRISLKGVEAKTYHWESQYPVPYSAPAVLCRQRISVCSISGQRKNFR